MFTGSIAPCGAESTRAASERDVTRAIRTPTKYDPLMRIGILTNEYPPNVYGGAGVHVEYLTRELAALDGGTPFRARAGVRHSGGFIADLIVDGVQPPVSIPARIRAMASCSTR